MISVWPWDNYSNISIPPKISKPYISCFQSKSTTGTPALHIICTWTPIYAISTLMKARAYFTHSLWACNPNLVKKKYSLMTILIWWPDQVRILHMAQQLSCQAMRKILTSLITEFKMRAKKEVSQNLNFKLVTFVKWIPSISAPAWEMINWNQSSWIFVLNKICLVAMEMDTDQTMPFHFLYTYHSLGFPCWSILIFQTGQWQQRHPLYWCRHSLSEIWYWYCDFHRPNTIHSYHITI